jgi:iron(III) transport system substrate-binding protein
MRSRTLTTARDRVTRLTQIVAMVSAVALSTVGAGVGVGGASQKDVTLVLYSGQHVQTTDSLVAGFEKAYPDVTVVVRSNDEDIFDAEIVAEGKHSPADVFYTENSPALEYLQQRGLLAKVDSSTLAHTPTRFNSPHGDWVGVSARVSVLIYNPSLIKKSALPTNVLALANPKYKGKLAFAAGETDFQPIVTSVLKAYGKKAALKWLDGIKANSASHVYPDNETIADEVNRGVVAFGVVNQYYWYRMRAEIGRSNMRSLITYFAPHNPGYVLDVSGAGILKSSTHKAAAQEFLSFLVSRKGQEIISHSISYEYPIASGVTTSQPETPFQDLKPYPISIAQLGTGSAAIALLNEVQLL